MTASSHQDQIIRVFRDAAERLSTRGLAQLCMDQNVFSREWLDSAGIRAAQETCRKALKTSDIHGLPIAGKTPDMDDGGAHLWEQREFWDLATYEINIDEYVHQGRANIEMARLLSDECRAVHGTARVVPILVGGSKPEEEAA